MLHSLDALGNSRVWSRASNPGRLKEGRYVCLLWPLAGAQFPCKGLQVQLQTQKKYTLCFGAVGKLHGIKMETRRRHGDDAQCAVVSCRMRLYEM